MRWQSRATCCALVLLLADCVRPYSASLAAHSSPPTNRSLLLLDEIRASGSATAYDVVESLRPAWLTKRGTQSFFFDKDVIVYLDAARLGDRTALREIPAMTVASMRFLDAKDANFRYGQGHPYGAIVVSTAFPRGK
jgi:hypothetical protein